MVEALVNAYARAKGIPVEEARQIVEPMITNREYRDELTEFLKDLGLIGGALRELPPESREAVTQALVSKVAEPEDEFDIRALRKLGLEMAAINAILNSAFGGNNRNDPMVEELRKQNELLRKELQELKETLRTREEEERRKEYEKRLRVLYKRLKSLDEKLDELKESSTVPNEQKKSALMSLAELVEEAQKEINALKKIGIKVGGSEQEVTLGRERLEIEKEKSKAWNKIMSEHIGPAIAELIKDPKKIVEVFRYAREIAESRNYMSSQAPEQPKPVSSELPKLEDYLVPKLPSEQRTEVSEEIKKAEKKEVSEGSLNVAEKD